MHSQFMSVHVRRTHQRMQSSLMWWCVLPAIIASSYSRTLRGHQVNDGAITGTAARVPMSSQVDNHDIGHTVVAHRHSAKTRQESMRSVRSVPDSVAPLATALKWTTATLPPSVSQPCSVGGVGRTCSILKSPIPTREFAFIHRARLAMTAYAHAPLHVQITCEGSQIDARTHTHVMNRQLILVVCFQTRRSQRLDCNCVTHVAASEFEFWTHTRVW